MTRIVHYGYTYLHRQFVCVKSKTTLLWRIWTAVQYCGLNCAARVNNEVARATTVARLLYACKEGISVPPYLSPMILIVPTIQPWINLDQWMYDQWSKVVEMLSYFWAQRVPRQRLHFSQGCGNESGTEPEDRDCWTLPYAPHTK